MNFVDHGGVGLVAFPNGPVLHVKDFGGEAVLGRFDDVQPTGCDNMPEQVSGLKCLIPTPP